MKRKSGANFNSIIIVFQPVWLELFLHIFAKHSLLYSPIYFLFALSLGFLCCFIYSLLGIVVKKNKTMRAIVKIGSLILWLVYVVELMCKSILQTYYSAGILSTAAENRLMDYIGQIVKVVLASIPQIIILLIPTILLFVCYNKKQKYPDFRKHRHLILSLVFSAAFHFAAFGITCINWPGDLQPKYLYNSDSYIVDQVEQLGLYTMLRLDLKHMIWPVSSYEEFSGMPTLTDAAIEIETKPAIDTSPNMMDIDLLGLSESTNNKDIKWLCDYFSSQTPTNKNEYTGIYKDYNVIVILMESFTGLVIDPVYTPTLYRLSTEGYNFKNFYTALHYTSTSNGEFQTLLGLYPKGGNPISMKRTGELGTNCYFSLAQQLNRIGYNSYGYHNNWDLYGRMASHNNLGYSWRFASRGLEMEWDGKELKWPQRDSFMIENSVNQYVNDEHFNIYYLTVSQHSPHSWNRIATQFRDQLTDSPYSDKTNAYIASAMEVDKAMAELLTELEAAGKLDNTLIVGCADHIPYSGVEIMEELAGKHFGSSDAVRAINESAIDFDIYRNTLFMWIANMDEPVNVDKVCCQVDILPTISNMLGLEYDSRMLAGKDIFSDDEGLVVFSSRSWKTDKGFYNRFTQKFTPADGVNMTEEETAQYVEYMKAQVSYKLDMTNKIIENDFYDVMSNSLQP